MPDARAQSIARLSRTINGTLDISEVFTRTLDEARLLTGGERVALLLVGKEGALQCQASWGFESAAWQTGRFHFARQLAARVCTAQQARLTSDAQVDLRPDLARSLGIQSILCAPLISHGHSIGALYVERRLTAGVFTADDLEHLEMVAIHCAVAIENARRYGSAMERARQESAATLAEAMVLSLLPQEAPQIPGYDIAARWQSAAEISADFYDIFPLPEGDRWGLVVADVSERGIPAAISMALARSIIRGSVSSAPGPAVGLERAHHLLCEHLKPERYVLAFYGELAPQGVLRYINAGHPAPLWWQARSGTFQALTSELPALCAHQRLVPVEHTVQLGRGDVLLFWSDGLAEICNPAGVPFGVERLQSLLAAHVTQPASLIAAALLEEVQLWLRGRHPHDDLLLIVLKHHPAPHPPA